MADEFLNLRKRRKISTQDKNKDTKADFCEIDRTSSNVQDSRILFGLIIFRFCNVFLVQTWFVPDEFWQGPEVAHRMVYGYGHLTWEWQEGIRSYIYPLLFAFVFKILNIFNADIPTMVIYLPRIIQAAFCAFGEFHIYKLAQLLYGASVAWWVLFCQVTSWFTFYCGTRTVTNAMETSLVSIGLYYWELSQNIEHLTTSKIAKQTSDIYKSLIFASLSCLVRPTSLVLWIPLGIRMLYQVSPVDFVLIFVFPVGVCSLIVSFLVDSYFYGKFVLVQYNFLYFNIMQNIGKIYGTHPWHWYMTQGMPVVLMSHLIPFGIAIYYCARPLQKWILLIVMDIIVFSLLSHKEFRFILPIVPIAMLICGKGLGHVANASVNKKIKKYEGNNARKRDVGFISLFLAAFLVLTNIPVAIYTGLIHQRGTLDVVGALEGSIRNMPNVSVLFLMPCHSTPYYSYIHKNVKMRFLDCTPNMQPGYVDEADRFYSNPQDWINESFGQELNNLPSHMILFDILVKDIKIFLKENYYAECGRYFYTHFPSGRLGSSVLLFCKVGNVRRGTSDIHLSSLLQQKSTTM